MTGAADPESRQHPRHPMRIVRWVRLGVGAVVVILIVMMVRRYEMLSLNEKDISMIPTISGGRRLLVDTWVGEDAPYDVGQIVLYGASIEGRSSKVVRIGRIEAKGGDVVEEREGTLWVGDRDLMAVSGPGLSPGKALEPGTFLVLVDNPALRLGPDPRGYPDSRQLGPVVEEDIVGRFIIQF